MIRYNDPYAAFEDLHGYHQYNSHRISPWLRDAAQAAVGVGLTNYGARLVGGRIGRFLAEHEMLALGWALGTLLELHNAYYEHTDGYGNFRDEFAKAAYNSAIGAAETTAVRKFSGLPPHVSAQIPVMIRHLDDEHF